MQIQIILRLYQPFGPLHLSIKTLEPPLLTIPRSTPVLPCSWRIFDIELLQINVKFIRAGHSNTSVVYMHDQKNANKGLFLKAIHENHDWVSKCACFQEKRSFFNSIKESLGVIFQTSLFHQNVPSQKKKSCLGVNLGAKIVQNSC